MMGDGDRAPSPARRITSQAPRNSSLGAGPGVGVGERAEYRQDQAGQSDADAVGEFPGLAAG